MLMFKELYSLHLSKWIAVIENKQKNEEGRNKQINHQMWELATGVLYFESKEQIQGLV